MESGEMLVKLLLLGESTVGKSCLLLRFAEDTFTATFLPTIGIDFKVRHTVLKDIKVKLQVWDTAGQEKFRTITKAYYRGANGILLVFDVTNVDSFEKVRNWMQSIRENTTEPVVIFLIGNKCDIPFRDPDDAPDEPRRHVTKEDAQKLAAEYDIPYFETSAKDGSNVESTFLHLAEVVLEREPMEERKDTTVTIVKTRRDAKQGRSCC